MGAWRESNSSAQAQRGLNFRGTRKYPGEPYTGGSPGDNTKRLSDP